MSVEMRRGYADTPFGQLFFVETGYGEPLILLHASPRSSSMWQELMPLLGNHYRLIAVDLPGFGESAPPPVPNGRADVAAMARSVFCALDALDLRKAHLCGIHTGAFIAAHAAVNVPERTGSLALVGYPFIESDAEIIRFFGGQVPVPGASRYGPFPDGSHLMMLWMAAYGQVEKNWLLRGGPRDPTRDEQGRNPTPHRLPHAFLTAKELAFIDRYMTDARRARYLAEVYSVMIAPSADLLARIIVPTLHIDPASVYESPYCRRGCRVASIVPRAHNIELANTDDNLAEFDAATLARPLREFFAAHPLPDRLHP